MKRVTAAVLLTVALAAACSRRPALVVPGAHYVVGGGYQASGTWFYPREDFHYDETGLATVIPAGRGLTADGEAANDTAMVAAHQTLQLPCIVLVTNLETGLQVRVRANDRGPESPGRLIALARRPAALLGMAQGGTARVRVQVDEAASTALREQLQGGPRLAVATAPRTAVISESLPPPAGLGQSTRGRTAAPARVASAETLPPSDRIPDRLPETVQRVAPAPGRLMIEAGVFGQAVYAERVAAKLGARVEQVREGRSNRYTVLSGPYPAVAAADAALDQAMRAGVSDARIVVR